MNLQTISISLKRQTRGRNDIPNELVRIHPLLPMRILFLVGELLEY
jgi:hypothetical protein